jgi:general secretion pathway protein D
MKSSTISKGRWLVVGFMLCVMGCAAGTTAFREGEELLQAGEYERAMERFEAAIAEDPGRHEYRMKWLGARNRAALHYLNLGRQELDRGNPMGAAAAFQQALALDSSLTLASQQLRSIQADQQAQVLIAAAERLYVQRQYYQAKASLQRALQLQPGNAQALELLQKVERTGQTVIDGFELELASDQLITLRLESVDMQQAFGILARLSGIDFIFDEEVPPRVITLELKKVSFAQALEILLKLNGLGRRVLNSKTILIYPQTPAKVKQYEDQIIQVFYLSNIDAKKAITMLRAMLQITKLYVHEERNALVMRDKPDVVKLARQILEAADRADSEVVFDLELVEVSHRDDLNLGPRLSRYGVGIGFGQGPNAENLVPDSLTPPPSGTYPPLIPTTGLAQGLSGLESFYTLPSATFDFAKTLADTEILANPKIRVKNREKAKVHIGTREPIVTTNISTTTSDVTSTNVQYVDVGVKLDVEPFIQLDNTVVTNLALEVSNVLERQVIAGGGVALRISTTNAQSSLTLKDGERTIIGGLIRDDISETRNTFPGLGSVPLVGPLVTGRNRSKQKREILLSITPYIVRSIELPHAEMATIWSSGEEDLQAGPRFATFAGERFQPGNTAGSLQQPLLPGTGRSLGPASAGMSLSLQVPAATVGQDLVVQVGMSAVHDLRQLGLTVRYPQQLVAFEGAEPGTLFSRPDQSVVLTSEGDEAAGTVTLRLQQTGDRTGASGFGHLLTLRFRALAPGKGQLQLTEPDFRNSAGAALAVREEASFVEVR